VPGTNHRAQSLTVRGEGFRELRRSRPAQSNFTPDASENQPTRGERGSRMAAPICREPVGCIE
jgi:hypothetical protein